MSPEAAPAKGAASEATKRAKAATRADRDPVRAKRLMGSPSRQNVLKNATGPGAELSMSRAEA